MTVREGWPPFEVWQQRRFILPRSRRISRLTDATVVLTVDFSRFNEVVGETTESLKHLAHTMVIKFKPKLGRWHWLGFHNKCSPIICKKAADLCNQAESDWRMEEYLAEQENGRYYTEYDAGVKIDPYLSHSQEWWDG